MSDKAREEIAKKLYDDFYLMVVNDKQRQAVADNIAGSILSVPSGLVAKKKCSQCCEGDIWYQAHADKDINLHDCPTCHGTGTISRELTIAEALEWAIEFIKIAKKCAFVKDMIYTASDERIEVNDALGKMGE